MPCVQYMTQHVYDMSYDNMCVMYIMNDMISYDMTQQHDIYIHTLDELQQVNTIIQP